MRRQVLKATHFSTIISPDCIGAYARHNGRMFCIKLIQHDTRGIGFVPYVNAKWIEFHPGLERPDLYWGAYSSMLNCFREGDDFRKVLKASVAQLIKLIEKRK